MLPWLQLLPHLGESILVKRPQGIGNHVPDRRPENDVSFESDSAIQRGKFIPGLIAVDDSQARPEHVHDRAVCFEVFQTKTGCLESQVGGPLHVEVV